MTPTEINHRILALSMALNLLRAAGQDEEASYVADMLTEYRVAARGEFVLEELLELPIMPIIPPAMIQKQEGMPIVTDDEGRKWYIMADDDGTLWRQGPG